MAPRKKKKKSWTKVLRDIVKPKKKEKKTKKKTEKEKKQEAGESLALRSSWGAWCWVALNIHSIGGKFMG